MFGKSVLSFFILFSLQVFAAQMGTVTADEAFIYLTADFDGQVIATAKRGEAFQISDKTSGPFYKIKLKDKRLGWISSMDIQPGVATLSDKKKKSNQPLESYTKEQRDMRTFAILRFQGPFVQSLDWKEKTLGKTRKSNLLFYGWNWTGFDTLVQGPFYIDTRISATFQAPDYYKKVTGVKASGWILKAQTSLVSANPVGENFLFHYGIGAVSTFAHFKTGILEGSQKNSHTAEELTVGLVLPLGFSYRLGPISTQIFYQYYIEKTQTAGLSLGFNWAF